MRSVSTTFCSLKLATLPAILELPYPSFALSELRAILRPTDAAEHEADSHVSHWWEAQLLHYGLRPSKAKAVAKTRLLDAMNQGTLSVPHDIVKLEGDLKKGWAKKEREDKAELKNAQSAKGKTAKATPSATSTPATKGSKRKAPQEEDIAAPSPAKKTKTAASQPKSFKSNPLNNHPRPKMFARRSGGFLSSGREEFTARGSSPAQSPARPKQTARCRRGGAPPFLPLKRENSTDDTYSDNYSANHCDNYSPQSIGLLNGRYELECSDLEEWQYNSEDFSLILTLDGTSLWGAYDFGAFEGILYLPTRPYAVLDDPIEFTWRGRETEGESSFGPNNKGWIKFLGNGEICGMINCYGEAMFKGQRISGNQTRSERDARSMKNEWDSYNQENYDRENRARWGGSGW